MKNRSKYRGNISEQSVVCTVLISAIIIEIFRKNIPISYIIPYKKLASPLIPVCLKKSHMKPEKIKIWKKSVLSIIKSPDHDFYVPFNLISVISGQWNGKHERLASERISPSAGFEPETP